jgi:hypothetical protein
VIASTISIAVPPTTNSSGGGGGGGGGCVYNPNAPARFDMGHSQFGRNEIKEVLLYMNYKNIFTNG